MADWTGMHVGLYVTSTYVSFEPGNIVIVIMYVLSHFTKTFHIVPNQNYKDSLHTHMCIL